MPFPILTPEELGEHLRASGKKGLALDIDDTLLLCDSAWVREFLDRCGNPENLTPADFFAKYGGSEDVPYWDMGEIEAIKDELLHSPTFHDNLQLIEGADEAVRAIDALEPIVAYITARPETVAESTRAWLIRHGFPEAPLIFRPGNSDWTQRSIWKSRVIAELFPLVTGVVDDHPHLAEQLAELGYPGAVYIYDHGMTSSVYLEEGVFRNWNEIVLAVQERTA